MAKLSDCWNCKRAVVEGQYINIAEMTYHATCFSCTRCQKNLYGKQFAAVGDPKTPTWKIYCNECDTLNASKTEINYKDERTNDEKRKNPAQKPIPQKPREPSPPPAPKRDPNSGVAEKTQFFKEQEAARLRAERLRRLEDEEKTQKKVETRQHLDTAAQMRQRQKDLDREEQERVAELNRKDAEERTKMRKETQNYQEQRKARVENELASQPQQLLRSNEEIFYDEPPSPPPSSTRSMASPSSRNTASAAPAPPPPPPMSSGAPPPPPPPPTFSSAPPPPPPPSLGGKGGGRAPARRDDDDDGGGGGGSGGIQVPGGDDPGRNALLDSIRGFRANRLRPTETNDRSAPIVDTRSGGGDDGGGGGGGARLPPGARGIGMGGNPMAAMAAAIASRRKQ